jgi:hypothetical protein
MFRVILRFILTGVVSVLVAGVAAGDDRPNIVFIMADDHAALPNGVDGPVTKLRGKRRTYRQPGFLKQVRSS